VLLVLVCFSGSALAQSDATRAEARERFDRGLRLVNQRDSDGALAEFARAYELVPHPLVLFNMGLVLASLGRPVEAVDAFDKLLAAPGNLDAERLARVKAELARQLTRVGQVEIHCSVSGATLEVDGLEVGRAPLSAPVRVASGAHVIGVSASGFVPQRKRLSVAGQASATVEFQLEQLAGPAAQLEISSSVPGADVLVDGEVVGKTPLAASLALAPGTLLVELRRAGYLSARRKVVLGEGSTGRLQLDPVTDPAALLREGGQLRLTIREPDAVIFVDGQPRGAYAGPLRLPHGEHLLRVERDQFIPFERKVSVPRGSSVELAIELEPTPEKRAVYRSRAVTQRTWGWVSIGAGAAFTLGAAGFLAWNASAESHAKAMFDAEALSNEKGRGGACDPELMSQDAACLEALQLSLADLKSVRSREKFGWIGGGVGLSVAALGVVLLVLNDDPNRYEPRPESDVFGGLSLAPSAWLGPGQGGLGLAGAF
jgi:hypothetical protein